MVSSASPAGTAAGTRKVACSFGASSTTSACWMRPPALIDALPNLISAAFSTIVDDGPASRRRMTTLPPNVASASLGVTVMS